MTLGALRALQGLVTTLNAVALGGALALGIAEGWDVFSAGASATALVGIAGVAWDLYREDEWEGGDEHDRHAGGQPRAAGAAADVEPR